MELQYNKWLELKIFHQYFSDENPSIFIIPTKETAVVLKRNNIIFRQFNGAFELYIGSESVDSDLASVLENIGILNFQVTCDDLLFFNYTDLPPTNSEEYYLFRNLLNSSDLIMEKASFESPEEQLKENSIGKLQINVNDLHTNSLNLIFHSRKVHFQYKIVIPQSRKIEVIDLIIIRDSNNEHFNGPVNEEVGGETALVFTSNETINLSKNLIKNPKLTMQYKKKAFSSSIHKLELKLPNPSPQNLIVIENVHFIASTIVYV